MSSFAIVVVVALAFCTEGALGFGATVVALSLGAFVVPVSVLLPAILPLNILLSATLVVRERAFVDRRLLIVRVLPFMALGVPFGFLLLSHVDAALARKALGAVVLALAAFTLLLRRSVGRAAPALLVAAGAVHGAFGTGGPLVVAALSGIEKRALRATLAVLWLILNVVLLVAFIADGRFTHASAQLVPACAVGALIGGVLGVKLHDVVDAARFTRVVWGALAVVGVVLLAR